jgi:hypothetical protein
VIRAVALAVAAALLTPAAQRAAAPVPGLTAGVAVAQLYDRILDADFAGVRQQLPAACGDAPAEACRVLDALSVWWEIALEPESRLRDVAFSRTVDEAIAATTAWTAREPERAEAWFYAGAAYGARAQWRILRQERLAAARDGKRIKETLERALLLDPGLDDARFGIGLYEYYADLAPSALRVLRWLLLLPGGDRARGLQQIEAARERGVLVRGEASYQLHLIYLWYEKRAREALTIVQALQQRYPANPLFPHIEAEILDVYFHDAAASLAASTRLLALAERGRVREAALASTRARFNMATQLMRLGDKTRALDLLNAIAIERPSRPYGATTRAHAMLKVFTARPRR